MKIGLVDKNGSLHPLAYGLKKNGNDVKYWITNKDKTKIGDGLVDKIDSEKELKGRLVIGEQGGGKDNHIGPTFIALKLEEDPLYARSVCESVGIKTLNTVKFTNLKEINNLKMDNGCILTTEGPSGDTTYTLKSKEYLNQYVNFETNVKKAKTFTVQERIDGIEISIEGWFCHYSGWHSPLLSTLNFNKTHSLTWHWRGETPKLFKQTFEKLTAYLTKIKFIGWLSGKFIIDYKTRQIYFLSFSFDYPWSAFCVLLGSDTGKFVTSVSGGESFKPSLFYTFIAIQHLYATSAPEMPVMAPLHEDARLYPCDVYL